MGIKTSAEQAYYGTSGTHGDYRYISLTEIINSFRAAYVGKGKICETVLDQDISFFALRGMQELSYDTLRSTKDWELTVPTSLVLVMPVDYVNYVKLSWSGDSGIEHIIYPAHKTSNPLDVSSDATADVQSWGGWTTDGTTTDLDSDEDSDTWTAYKSATSAENQTDYDDDYYVNKLGQRYGLNPAHAQVNGSFFIDESAGKFHFSSNLSGKTLILKYISDGIVTNAANTALDLDATYLHKFAEEAMYKYIAYGLLSARSNTPPHILQLLKKERFAETRKAKLRLSNIKIEELTQVIRGKSKIIKH